MEGIVRLGFDVYSCDRYGDIKGISCEGVSYCCATGFTAEVEQSYFVREWWFKEEVRDRDRVIYLLEHVLMVLGGIFAVVNLEEVKYIC